LLELAGAGVATMLVPVLDRVELEEEQIYIFLILLLEDWISILGV
jgi:hypothetical protein